MLELILYTAKMTIHVIEAGGTSVVHLMGEGFYLLIIPHAQNCLEDMLNKLHGDSMFFTLGSMKGFMFSIDHTCFRNGGGDGHDEWEKAYLFK